MAIIRQDFDELESGGLEFSQTHVVGGSLSASSSLSVTNCPFKPLLIVVRVQNSNGDNIGSNVDSNGNISEDTLYFYDKNGSSYTTMSITITNTGFTGGVWSGYSRDYICMLFG